MPVPRRGLPTRFWLDSALSGAFGVLSVITLFWHDWLEAVGWDPDQGNGSAEWVVVGVLAAVALLSGAVARWEWRRVRPA
jgi:hypothetical protein